MPPPLSRRMSPLDYAALSDLDLVPLAARGREGAFREILERYQGPVFSLIFRMVRDRELAEDLAQEAFVRAFNALEGFNPKYKFSSWLFKIANNLTIDHLRKRTLDTVSMDGAPDAVSADEQAGSRIVVEDSSERPDAFVENRELGGRIEVAIGALRPEYRTAVLLRHVEGYSYEEVADIMEVPLGTVKTFLHRARAELKEQLAGIHGE